MSSKQILKKRHWCFVLYPESAPVDWRETLQKTGLLCAISPLHDKDLNPTGEPKKAHHHVMMTYNGPTTYNVVAALTNLLNATIPIALENLKGMYRYFTHKDNPEKAQYDEADISTLNGFNIADLCELTKSEVNALKIRIQKLIRDMDIIEYSELMDVLLDNELNAEYDVACNHTLFFDRYISSRRNAISRAEREY